MELLGFITTTILVTASGALAPGPLFFASLSHGAKSGARTGLIFSIAHSLIEFSLVMLLALGLNVTANETGVRLVIGLTGGVVLIIFGVWQIHRSLVQEYKKDELKDVASKNLFVIGLSFTGLNPFFIIWWLTAGAQLVIMSLEFASFTGVVLMYVCHVWMDYVWLTATSHFSRTGLSIVGFKWYRLALIAFGGVLVYFGLTFLVDALTS